MRYTQLLSITKDKATQDDVAVFNQLAQAVKESDTKEICNNMSLVQCDMLIPIYTKYLESLYSHNCVKEGRIYSPVLEKVIFYKRYYLVRRMEELLK